ncbi:hypothetical protein JCM10213_007793 [Rhodosporidiobolus nylandii]
MDSTAQEDDTTGAGEASGAVHFFADPDTQPPRRPPTSFASLPPELKLRIAEHVRAEHVRDVRDSNGGREPSEVAQVDGNALVADMRGMLLRQGQRTTNELANMMNELVAKGLPCRRGLFALSLVDREMYLICRPMLWAHVDLTDRTCPSIITFIRDILPRQGPLIRSLWWTHDSLLKEDEVGEPTDGFFSPQQKAVVEAAEHMGGVDADESAFVRKVRAAGLLIAEVVQQCSSLEEVNMVSLDMRTWWADDFPPFVPEYPLNALVALKPRLTVIDYEFDSSVDLKSGSFTLLLENSPDLEDLEITGTVMEDDLKDPDYHRLFRAISQLKKLEYLELRDLPLPSFFYTSPPELPLRTLSLTSTGPNSPTALAAFLSTFSGTLTDLALHYIMHEEDEIRTSTSTRPRLSLPLLTHYTSSTYFHPTILASLSSSPLQIVRIEDCGAGSADLLVACLAEHTATLERFELLVSDLEPSIDDDEMSVTERERLSEWCEAAGVKYVVEEREADSSEEESSQEAWTDLDASGDEDDEPYF